MSFPLSTIMVTQEFGLWVHSSSCDDSLYICTKADGFGCVALCDVVRMILVPSHAGLFFLNMREKGPRPYLARRARGRGFTRS